jgi:hypothetical protein
MSWMLLIVEPRGQRALRSEEQGRGLYQRMLDYGEHLQQQGLLLASNSLREAATRVQRRDGRPQLVDGPFTESKELVGGFYLIDCESREQALQIAAACPAAEWASVEVREVAPCYE